MQKNGNIFYKRNFRFLCHSQCQHHLHSAVRVLKYADPKNRTSWADLSMWDLISTNDPAVGQIVSRSVNVTG